MTFRVPALFRPAFAAAAGMLLAFGLLTASCTTEPPIVLETREGVEITIRHSRDARATPAGPEFQEALETKVERSLNRVVVRYAKVIVFNKSDPAPLFTPQQVRALTEILARELPKLGPAQRVGLLFEDQYRREIVDLEVYPEGDFLVYDFRALMQNPEDRLRTRGQPPPNRGVIYPQRNQESKGGRFPLLKDPIASAARPDFELRDEDEKEQAEEDVSF